MFDQEGLVSRIPTWDWEDSATWRQVRDDWHFLSKSLIKLLGASSVWTYN
jgi:hypothetical protein